jgi:hypothetical protein
MPESAGGNLVRLASRAALAATDTAEAAAQAEDALAVAPQPSGEQQLAATTTTRRTLAARCGRFASGSPGSSGSQARAPHEATRQGDTQGLGLSRCCCRRGAPELCRCCAQDRCLHHPRGAQRESLTCPNASVDAVAARPPAFQPPASA